MEKSTYDKLVRAAKEAAVVLIAAAVVWFCWNAFFTSRGDSINGVDYRQYSRGGF